MEQQIKSKSGSVHLDEATKKRLIAWYGRTYRQNNEPPQSVGFIARLALQTYLTNCESEAGLTADQVVNNFGGIDETQN